MSRFKNGERVQIIATHSAHLHAYGTVVETDAVSVRVRVDGISKDMRFWDDELLPAPSVPAPGKELVRTQAYLREMEEDAKLLFNTVDLLPRGDVQSAVVVEAERLSKIASTFRLLLKQDGVEFRETEDGGK